MDNDLKETIQFLVDSGSITIQSLDDDELRQATRYMRECARSRRRTIRAPTISLEEQCLARIWKGECGTEGVGSRCKKQAKDGHFCGMHGRLGCPRTRHTAVPDKVSPYSWEHHGRWDQPPPTHFKNPNCWSHTAGHGGSDPEEAIKTAARVSMAAAVSSKKKVTKTLKLLRLSSSSSPGPTNDTTPTTTNTTPSFPCYTLIGCKARKNTKKLISPQLPESERPTPWKDQPNGYYEHEGHFKCSLCDFTQPTNKSTEMAQHCCKHFPPTHNCLACGDAFYLKTGWREHFLYQCNRCGKTVKKGSISSHNGSCVALK